ncbi:hypothetical protein COO91_03857 [Nostoc flagelliforme CCNUN1]|uniref:Uncharacterized protein n=1 Tax=Nostoc flagelliforme CCNUN1 TaxID=2038116 RepID=A0A2K8SR23_9NOSO|nr:hypothetical protein COO91_03857 [Nostoc flagelliforme CCNUN1]
MLWQCLLASGGLPCRVATASKNENVLKSVTIDGIVCKRVN